MCSAPRNNWDVVAGLLRRIAPACLLLLALEQLPVRSRFVAAQEPDGAEFHEIGVQQCALCHYSGTNPILEPFRATEFVALDETHRWLENDRHYLAFRLIDPRSDGESNRLSRRICETLEIDVGTFGDPTNLKARDCLSCHAGWTNPASPPSQAALQFGVSCEACHGPASIWARPENHQQPTWRKTPPEEKRQRYGMRGLHDAVERARVCYSCHIGNVDENKVVTHAMYAAGHPPLPSIELASFSAGMGAHWRSLTEKGDSFQFRDDYVRLHHPYLRNADGALRAPAEDLPQTRLLLVGGALAMAQSVQLMQAQAQDASRAWPDFAAYDCAACHHELRVASERQPVSIAADEWLPPGRPLHATWPTVTSGVASAFLDADHQSAQAIRAFRSILAEKPFGLREKIADASGPAAAVQRNFQEVAAQLAARPLSAEDGLEMLRALCQAPADHRERADFESARQRAWAIEVISNELNGKLEYATDQPAFDATLAHMREGLLLRLPNDARVARSAVQPEDRVTRERSMRLEAVERFEPAVFAAQLARLRELLLEGP